MLKMEQESYLKKNKIMLIINENSELKNKKFIIPKNLSQHLNQTLSKYGEYSNNKGYKRLNSLVNPNYNKRSKNSENNNQKYISYNDLKRIDFDIRHMDKNPDNIEFKLNGGEKMAKFVRDSLNRERTKVAPTLKQKKVNTINKNMVKPIKMPTKPNNVENLRESTDNLEHPFYDYLSDYDVYNVLSAFKDNENIWLPLINPNMYKKALDEFTKYGNLIHFPVKYIYQWMGIIMKNTAILITTTEIAGHSSFCPIDEIVDFFFDENNEDDNFEKYKEVNGYNDDYDAISNFLDDIGYYDWALLPDETDAISDYGIEPICNLIKKYNRNMPPEEVLVLINKILDITHCRGDLSSMFIEGGKKTLNQISEKKKINKTIFINESHLKIIKNNIDKKNNSHKI